MNTPEIKLDIDNKKISIRIDHHGDLLDIVKILANAGYCTRIVEREDENGRYSWQKVKSIEIWTQP